MLKIVDVNRQNFSSVLALKVGKSQVNYVESNGDSIAEAKYFNYWDPVALYDDDLLVGFAMYGKIESENGRVWLDRYMISEDFQGKGYGRGFLEKILEFLVEKYNCKEIYLSAYDNNELAIGLYESVGFKFNGEVDREGELIMCLSIKNK